MDIIGMIETARFFGLCGLEQPPLEEDDGEESLARLMEQDGGCIGRIANYSVDISITTAIVKREGKVRARFFVPRLDHARVLRKMRDMDCTAYLRYMRRRYHELPKPAVRRLKRVRKLGNLWKS